jgi:hypothetical protein
MKKLLLATALTVALYGTPPALRAAESNPTPPDAAAKTEKSAKRIPFHGKISAVDATAKTFTLTGKEKARTFQVISETRLKKDGKEAAFEDLKVGETVGGQYRAGAAGALEAVLVNLGAKPEKEKAVEKPDTKSDK